METKSLSDTYRDHLNNIKTNTIPIITFKFIRISLMASIVFSAGPAMLNTQYCVTKTTTKSIQKHFGRVELFVLISDQMCCVVRCVKVRGWSVTPVWLITRRSVTGRALLCVLRTQMPAPQSQAHVSPRTFTPAVRLLATRGRHLSKPVPISCRI